MVCQCKAATDIITVKLANAKIDAMDFMLIAQLDNGNTQFLTDREDSFDMPSSFIGKVVYFEDQTMTISIGGRIFNYCNVPRRTFESFKGADSKGAFFSRNIRNQLEC